MLFPESGTKYAIGDDMNAHEHSDSPTIDPTSTRANDPAQTHHGRAGPPGPRQQMLLPDAPSRGSKTTIKADLIAAAYAACPHLSRAQARALFEMTFAEISNALGQGDAVKLLNFGAFSIHSKHARPGRNPRTGVEVQIAPRRVLTFKPSPALLAALNPSGHRCGAPKRLFETALPAGSHSSTHKAGASGTV